MDQTMFCEHIIWGEPADCKAGALKLIEDL